MLDKMEQTLREELLLSYQNGNEESYVFSEHSFLLFLEHIKNINIFTKSICKLENHFL